MQGVCPQCAKNGQENTSIKAFQINFNEAVFMCSNVECIWPAGYQELTIISRQIGKEYSSNWEKVAQKYIKTEQDQSVEFQPQTPAALCDIMSIPAEDIIFLSDDEQISNSFNKPSNFMIDSTINSKVNSKPKVVSIEIISSNSITGNRKPVLIKTGNITLGPPIIKQVKVESKNTSKGFNSARNIGHPYEKFNLNDLSKPKRTNVSNEYKPNVIKVNKTEIKTEDYLDDLSTIAGNLNSNLSNIIVDSPNGNEIDLNSILNLTNKFENSEVGDLISDDGFDLNLDEILKTFSNEKNSTIKCELENSDECKWMNNLLQG